eukprot:g18241.t1
MHQAAQVLPWWGSFFSLRTFFGLRLMQLGYHELIRRLPVPAFLECSNRYSRKEVDTSAVSVNDTARLSESKLRCHLGGPKYRHEHHQAEKLAACFGDHEQWSWALIWVCWCEVKFRRGMLQFLDYELCDSTLREVYSTAADRTVEEAPAGEKLNGTTTGPLGQTRAECQEILIGVAREERRMGVTGMTDGPRTPLVLDLAACSAFISSSSKRSAWLVALQAFEVIGRAAVRVDEMAYCSSITALERGSQWEAALEQLNNMHAGRLQRNVFAYGAAVAAVPHWPLALELLRGMQAEMILPSTVALDSVVHLAEIHAWEAGSHWATAVALLHGAGRSPPNMICRSAAMSACERESQWQSAVAILKCMMDDGLQPDVVAYSTATSACEKAWQWQRALLLDMEERSIPLNTFSYNAAISACAAGRALELAVDLFSTMCSKRVKSHDWRLAVDFLQSMFAQDLQPNIVTYGAAISACEKSIAWPAALALLAQAQRQREAQGAHCAHSLWVYNALQSALEKGQQWQKSLHLLAGMTFDSLTPDCLSIRGRMDAVSYNAALAACRRAFQWQRALELVRSAQEVNTVDALALDSALVACAAANAVEALPALGERLARAGLPRRMARKGVQCVEL